ncbi:MAG: DUF2281 domain-containing protein, partial [Gammaproteobacteria bacterium]
INRSNLMRLDEAVQQHVARLPEHLQTEVYDFVLFLEQKQAKQRMLPTEAEALDMHWQLMDRYAEAFKKLAHCA